MPGLRQVDLQQACLDNTYIPAPPGVVRAPYAACQPVLWAHARARLELNCRRTRAVGKEPPGISALQGDADAAVWVGDGALPPDQQGLAVLGAPLGNNAYVR